ncbi:uncharacterized protein LOC142176720 [Nicotiana tabacum]|uniref:Uncharacterized protein LOC142176720 n=1 Tax=Nicotiana tabacum TaxID=4097 RepID=A0AC58TUY7_TOBAC
MAIREEIPAGTSTNTTTTTIDHHHPLFLQPSDTPSSSLISIQLTGSENYAVWSRSMRIGLIGKSKLGFVDGRCTKDKFDQSLHELWEKCNAIVLSWIMNARLLQFLMGLNETYAQPRSQFLMMSPIPSVNKAYSMVVSEESQRNMGKPAQTLDMGDNTTLFTNKGGMTIGNTYKPRRNNLFCDYCNYKGHTRETCYKIHGYPNDFKVRRKANNFPQRPMVNTTTNEGQ